MYKISVPLRVDFAGGWLDVPAFARPHGHIVNVAITPKVSLAELTTNRYAGLGGSAARSLLHGKDAVATELAAAAGWQDPAVILETGLCVWCSGDRPRLEMKVNPYELLNGKMALLWMGPRPAGTPTLADKQRDLGLILRAGQLARLGVREGSLRTLAYAVECTYKIQLMEGMSALPDYGALACKYCGAGHGGNALYLFEDYGRRQEFLRDVSDAFPVEPFMEPFG